MCIHIKEIHNTRPLCRPISFDFLQYPWFEFTCIYIYISYANSPVSLLPLLPVYGVSNALLFGTSGYQWIEILISLNHYDISKSTHLSLIGKSNHRCHGTYIVYMNHWALVKRVNLLVFVDWDLCGTRTSASTMAEDGSRYQSSSHRQKS